MASKLWVVSAIACACWTVAGLTLLPAVSVIGQSALAAEEKADDAATINLVAGRQSVDDWVLEQHDEVGAKGEKRAVDGAVEFKVTKAGTEDWHVQGYLPNIDLKDEQHLTVRFKIKADKARAIVIHAGQQQEPYQSVCGWTTVQATTEWTTVGFEGVVKGAQAGNTRVPALGLGKEVGTVWVKDVEVLVAAPASLAKEFFPFVIPYDDAKKGTATDVGSVLSPTAAGANGRIVVRDGHFVEEKSGKRIKFWAANVTAVDAFPEKADAEALAARLAKYGVNLVRLHHMDNPWGVDGGQSLWAPGSKDRQTYNKDNLDKLDYLIACLKKHGIYINMNLKVSRQFLPGDGFPESVNDIPDFDKRVDKYEPRMIALQKDHARKFLTRKNPYTGMTLIEDPVMAIVEINNENSLVNFSGSPMGAGLEAMPEPFKGQLVSLWNNWLTAKYGTTAKLRAGWSAGVLPGKPGILNKDTPWVENAQGEMKMKITPGGQGSDTRAADASITVENTVGPEWHAQALIAGLTLEKGRSYVLKFTARASKERKMGVGLTLDQADWRNLGFAESVALGTKEKSFRLPFVAGDVVADHSRFVFTVGNADGTVEVSGVELVPADANDVLPSGQTLETRTVEMPGGGGSRAQQTDWLSFLAETERAYGETMRKVLRDELHVKASIIDRQLQWGSATALYREEQSEFADTHQYWQHPDFPGKPWDANNWRIGRKMVADELAEGRYATLDLAMYRVAGKPFTVSEYDHPAPNDFAAEMLPMISSFAAAQDWDAIYPFCQSAHGANVKPDTIQGYFDQSSNPAKFAFTPSAAIILRSGAMDPLAGAKTVDVPLRLWETFDGLPSVWRKADLTVDGMLANRLVVKVAGGPSAGAPASSAARTPTTVDILKSPAGNLYRAVGWGAVAAAGKFDGTPVVLGPMTWTCQDKADPFAAMTLVTLDNKPLNQPGRLLLTVLNRAENNGMGWNADRTTVGSVWGTGPVMIKQTTARVSIAGHAGNKVFALKPDGTRAGPVATETSGDSLRFTITPSDKTVWYEIVP